MTFQEYFEDSRVSIKNHLKVFFDEKRSEKLPQVFKEQRLIDSLESFALRGKLIRGTLFLFAAEALGLSKNKEILDIACGIELMHSSLLTQDDIIDNDYIRRGEKTIFAKYKDSGVEIGAFDPYHYGISTAIVVADVAFFFAVELISGFDNSSLSKLLKYYSHEIYLVSLAESADSIFGQTEREPEREDIYEVYRYKTARYTFSLPFEMAAIIAKTSTEKRQHLSELGEFLGIIFQLRDDEIGLFGDEEKIGKPVGSDIRENKKTIIRSLLYKYANESDRETLSRIFGNPKTGIGEIEEIRKIYDKYEIKKHIEKEIEVLMGKSWNIYEQLEMEGIYKEILRELLDFNLKRTV